MRNETLRAICARAAFVFPFYLVICVFLLVVLSVTQVTAFPLCVTIEDISANWAHYAQPITNDPNGDDRMLLNSQRANPISPYIFNQFHPADVLTFDKGKSEGLMAGMDITLEKKMGISIQHGTVQATKDAGSGIMWDYIPSADPTQPELYTGYGVRLMRTNNPNSDRKGVVVWRNDGTGPEEILWQDASVGLESFTKYSFHIERSGMTPDLVHIVIENISSSLTVFDKVVSDNGPMLPAGAPALFNDNGFDFQWGKMTVVPEPNAFVLVGMGLLGLTMVSFRFRRHQRWAYEVINS